MPVRVIYHFQVQAERVPEFVQAYEQIVLAHAAHGGALGSVLLRDPEDQTRFVAISTWRSREAWLLGRTDAADPQAYALFRQVATVLSKQCLDQVLDLS